MAVAALIVTLMFAALFGVRLFGARRARIRRGQIYATLLAGVGLVLAARGVFALAAGLGVAAFIAWAWDKQQPTPAGPAPKTVDEEALRLLGLSPDPSAAQIRAAFRSKMAQAHPDKGGDSALAAKLVAARDRLLRQFD